MSYVVRIVGPAGMQTFLARDKEVAYEHEADRFEEIEKADAAGHAYRVRFSNQNFIYDVYDPEAM